MTKYLFFCFAIFQMATSQIFPSTFKILHFNDIHGYFGNVAKYQEKIEQIRKDTGTSTLLLFAGDLNTGNLVADGLNMLPGILTMNLLKFDAAVLGNHEFDFFENQLLKQLEWANFDFLGANVIFTSPTAIGLKVKNKISPSKISKVSGLNVGIIGLVTSETPGHSRYFEFYSKEKKASSIDFTSLAEKTQATAGNTSPPKARDFLGKLLKIEGNKKSICVSNCDTTSPGFKDVDMVIVLSHSGLEQDLEVCKVEGVDLVISGHDHTYNGGKGKDSVGKCLVAQEDPYGKSMGIVEVTKTSESISFKRSRITLSEVKNAKVSDAISGLALAEADLRDGGTKTSSGKVKMHDIEQNWSITPNIALGKLDFLVTEGQDSLAVSKPLRNPYSSANSFVAKSDLEKDEEIYNQFYRFPLGVEIINNLLSPKKDPDISDLESRHTLVNIVLEAYTSVSHADFSLINGGGVRAGFVQEEKFSPLKLSEFHPFGGPMFKVTLSRENTTSLMSFLYRNTEHEQTMVHSDYYNYFDSFERKQELTFTISFYLLNIAKFCASNTLSDKFPRDKQSCSSKVTIAEYLAKEVKEDFTLIPLPNFSILGNQVGKNKISKIVRTTEEIFSKQYKDGVEIIPTPLLDIDLVANYMKISVSSEDKKELIFKYFSYK